MLKKLRLETIKISSGDFSNLQLINEALSFKKIILSTGLSDHKEIEKVLNFIKKRKKLRGYACFIATRITQLNQLT